MPAIRLKTTIHAPIERVFDLSRSVDLHVRSTARTGERAIAGRLSGLMELDETVTWEARHFGFTQRLTSKIVKYDRPTHFRDSMQTGAFARFDHDHVFEEINGATLMKDIFDYDSPLGLLGRIADRLFLENHMRRLLVERNRMLKVTAEGSNWRNFI